MEVIIDFGLYSRAFDSPVIVEAFEFLIIVKVELIAVLRNELRHLILQNQRKEYPFETDPVRLRSLANS